MTSQMNGMTDQTVKAKKSHYLSIRMSQLKALACPGFPFFKGIDISLRNSSSQDLQYVPGDHYIRK
jgi:hypothetical protein